MKTLLKSTLGVFLLTGLLIFHSCERSPLDLQAEPEKASAVAAFSVVDGRLVFQEMDTYRKILEELASNSHTLNEWEQQLTGYRSMFTAYQQLTEAEQEQIGTAYLQDGALAGYENIVSIIRGPDGELEAVSNVDFPILERLVNDDGLIQIGDSLYKYTYNQIAKVVHADERQLKLLQRAHAGNMPSFGSIVQIERGTDPISAARAGNNTCTSTYNNGKRRLKGEINSFKNEPIDKGYSAVTKHQRKVLGIWWGDECPQLRVQGSGTVQWGGVIDTVDLDFTDYDVSSTGARNLSTCSYYCLEGPVDLYATHTCSCGGGLTCNTDYQD